MALFTNHTGALLKFYQRSGHCAPSRREAGRPDSSPDTGHECYLFCRLVFSRVSVLGGGTRGLAWDCVGGWPVTVLGCVLWLAEVTLRWLVRWPGTGAWSHIKDWSQLRVTFSWPLWFLGGRSDWIADVQNIMSTSPQCSLILYDGQKGSQILV